MGLFPVSNALMLHCLFFFFMIILLGIVLFAPFFPHSPSCIECLSVTGLEFRQPVLAEKDNSKENLCFGKTIRIVPVV